MFKWVNQSVLLQTIHSLAMKVNFFVGFGQFLLDSGTFTKHVVKAELPKSGISALAHRYPIIYF
jgi:hypothetical protein